MKAGTPIYLVWCDQKYGGSRTISVHSNMRTCTEGINDAVETFIKKSPQMTVKDRLRLRQHHKIEGYVEFGFQLLFLKD